MPANKKALYVSYNAVTEPLVKSQVLPYLELLSKKGVSFSLISFEKDKNSGPLPGVDWIKLRFHKKPLLPAKVFDILTGMTVVFRVIASRKIDIVHSRGVIAAAMALLPSRILGVHSVFDMKSSLAEAYRTSGRIKEKSLYYRFLSVLEKICVKNSDEVIVETEEHKKALLAMIGKNKGPVITVIPCCVDVKRFASYAETINAADKPMRLVYLGSLSGWYMVPEMLDFFGTLKKNYPDAEFLFLTDDKDGSMAKAVKDKGTGGVKIRKVPYDDVPKELAASTAGIIFKFPNSRLDSFPIKIAEYLAAGLPIIINSGMGDVEKLVMANRVGVVVGSCNKDGYERAIKDLRLLIDEKNVLKERCIDLAEKNLSLSYGLSRYEKAYGLIS